MFYGTSFGKTLDLLHRNMDVAVLRRSVISNNIANADTPNFKRSQINFESELQRALESEKPTGRLQAALTDQKHIPFHTSTDYRTVKPKKVLDYLTQADNNGNNVDLEEEMMAELQNQLRYEIMTRSVANQFSQMNTVLR
ncbi:flagellar basal body rod protein FlgB [Marispirochaeta sp.]|jgi:flagellar basal-body rod protein FlgB|uniref:flagellar basal body rod protein FlgB n=1 Tax=Marispirochaeta sp. TaxID=2038653 RepID=UPI0029C8F171|nr:flagellar basal body rod protein FlgB [Marispirochaeta sp.]